MTTATLEHGFDRIRTSSSGAGNTKRGLTHPIRSHRMEGFMEPTNFRNPARWNSVVVPPEVAERAYTNTDKRDDGCWISRYSVASHGYAQIGWSAIGRSGPGGRKNHGVLAHRAAWTHVNGQVPLGMTLDHLCKVRTCVNPEHLRLLPNYENARRVDGQDWPLGYCKRGHPNSELRDHPSARKKSGQLRECEICRTARYRRNLWLIRHPGEPIPPEIAANTTSEVA